MAELWLWGDNGNGALGDGTTDSKSSPVQTISGGSDWHKVACGYLNTLAIKEDGTLWTWGANYHGSLGDGTQNNASSPIQIGTDTNWSDLAAGNAYWDGSAAIKEDGTLWLWGYNEEGSIGDETTDDRSSPVQTVAGGMNWKQVSRAWDHTAAVKTDGTLWMWGNNYAGALGDGTTDSKSSPIQTIAGGTNWKQVAVGGQDSTTPFAAAVKTDGTLWTWGYNSNGQLGDGTTDNKSSPVQTMAGGTNWSKVSCGGYFISALKTDGTLWTWGYNGYGQLGDGTTTDSSSPVQVAGNNWIEVASGYAHVIARKSDGTVWTWGSNYAGELGNGESSYGASSPIQLGTNTTWTQVSSGYYHTAALSGPLSPTPEVSTSCAKTTCAGQKGFACFKPDSTCTCAKWKFFNANCTRSQNALGICSSLSGAYVPAITVCNQRLY